MNAKYFSEAMNEVADRYYMEVVDYQPKFKRHGIIKYCAIAACFAIVLFIVFSILPNYSDQKVAIPPDDPIGIQLVVPEIQIDMKSISLNVITGFSDTARRWYDPDLYDDVVWYKEDILAYYGEDLTPAYIPDGLYASPQNDTTIVHVGKDGTVAEDTVWLGYYHDYYEDGSPKLTEEVAACKGLSIVISKIGIVNDCCYLMPENEVKTSGIGGVAVTFGYRSMSYGPYGPETHEPSGYYEMYVAEFEQDGIEYQIVTEQMEIEELVKVVASIIYGEDEIVIND